MDEFYRKPGKLGATTPAVWADILMRREGLDRAAAEQEVAARIADGRLVASRDD